MLYTHLVTSATEPDFLYDLVEIAPIYYEEPHHRLARDRVDWFNSVKLPGIPDSEYKDYEYKVFVYDDHFDTFEFIVAIAGATCKRINDKML